jgi:hypothetical protein
LIVGIGSFLFLILILLLIYKIKCKKPQAAANLALPSNGQEKNLDSTTEMKIVEDLSKSTLSRFYFS